jgi:hypothetical protein
MRTAEAAAGLIPHSGAIRSPQSPNPSYRPDPLRKMRRGHAYPHLQGLSVLLLCLFDKGPAGAHSVQRYGGADGEARQSGRQATTRSVVWLSEISF